MIDNYFFDTYAIIEILKGNPAYEKYKNKKIMVTIFNLVELHYKLLIDFNERLAKEILEKYSKFVVDVNLEIIEETNKLKLFYKKQRLSIPDVMGYITAKKLGIKFLTGDKEFADMENVEFVK